MYEMWFYLTKKEEDIIRGADGKLTYTYMDRQLLERAIAVMKWNIQGRHIRAHAVWKRYKSNGAILDNFEYEAMSKAEKEYWKNEYRGLPKTQLGELKKRLTGKLEHTQYSKELLERMIEEMQLQEDIRNCFRGNF